MKGKLSMHQQTQAVTHMHVAIARTIGVELRRTLNDKTGISFKLN